MNSIIRTISTAPPESELLLNAVKTQSQEQKPGIVTEEIGISTMATCPLHKWLLWDQPGAHWSTPPLNVTVKVLLGATQM